MDTIRRAALLLGPLLLAALLFSACDLSAGRPPETATFVIVDQPTNKVLNVYEYDHSDTLISAEIYNDQEKLVRKIEYYYDPGNGVLSSTMERLPGGRSLYTTYTTETEHDGTGRLTKAVQTSSGGTVVETYYGYDEEGTLRGVVEQTNGDSVLMKDYEN